MFVFRVHKFRFTNYYSSKVSDSLKTIFKLLISSQSFISGYVLSVTWSKPKTQDKQVLLETQKFKLGFFIWSETWFCFNLTWVLQILQFLNIWLLNFLSEFMNPFRLFLKLLKCLKWPSGNFKQGNSNHIHSDSRYGCYLLPSL